MVLACCRLPQLPADLSNPAGPAPPIARQRATTVAQLRRRELARAVERLLLARLGGRELSVQELAALFEVSRTTLNQALQDEFGMGYVALLRQRRLLQVRLALAQDPEGVVLAQLARQAGFDQPGRFSRYYRDAFGRLPSEEQAAFLQLARGRDGLPSSHSVNDPFAGYRRRGRPPVAADCGTPGQ